MFENYVTQPNITGEDGGSPSLSSYVFLLSDIFFFSGQSLTDQEIFTYNCINTCVVKKVSIESLNLRTAGTLTFQLLKNNTPVGSTFLIDNTNPMYTKLTGLSVNLVVNDILSLQVTSLGYSPNSNRFKINVEVEKTNG